MNETPQCQPDGRRRVRRRIVGRSAPTLQTAAPGQAGAQPALLRPEVTCPRCGARPAMRVTSTIVAALANTAPGEQVGTYQCQRRGCGSVYPLTADAYQRAA